MEKVVLKKSGEFTEYWSGKRRRPYYVEESDPHTGCKKCGVGRTWVVRGPSLKNGHDTQLYEEIEEKLEAEDYAKMLNDAFETALNFEEERLDGIER